MTKTEYREYIASEAWKARRKKYLDELRPCACQRCNLPRWLCVVAYDQDIHVHHRSYANVGNELPGDLEPLCRRCHEMETFGSSDLHRPQSRNCTYCGAQTYDGIRRMCAHCSFFADDAFDVWVDHKAGDLTGGQVTILGLLYVKGSKWIENALSKAKAYAAERSA